MKKFSKAFLIFSCATFVGCFCAVASVGSGKHTHATEEQYVCKRCDGAKVDPYVTKNCVHCNKGTVEQYMDCAACNGLGYTVDKYGDKSKCTACDGAKAVRTKVTCPDCGGNYQQPLPCLQCKGTGYVNR